VIIHTDASCKENIVGLGYIIKNNSNNNTHENATFKTGDYSSMDAEYLAVREAAKVVENHFEAEMPVYFYTDCQALTKKLDNPDSDKWKKRVQELSLIMTQEFRVKWIPRERNRKADSLAGTGRRRGATQAAD